MALGVLLGLTGSILINVGNNVQATQRTVSATHRSAGRLK